MYLYTCIHQTRLSTLLSLPSPRHALQRGHRGGARPPGAPAVWTSRGRKDRPFFSDSRAGGMKPRSDAAKATFGRAEGVGSGAGEGSRPPPTGLEVRSHLAVPPQARNG